MVVVHVGLTDREYPMNVKNTDKREICYSEQYDLESYCNYNCIENVLHDVHRHISTNDFHSVADEYLSSSRKSGVYNHIDLWIWNLEKENTNIGFNFHLLILCADQNRMKVEYVFLIVE